MKLVHLDPHAIKVPEVRVTADFPPELLATFKESLDAIGQVAPIIVYQVEEELVLCDGLHRLQAAIERGDKTIPAIVIPGDEVDVLTRNLALDHLRGKTPVTQMVKVLKTLSDDYHLDPDQIAEKTFKNREYVEKLLKIGTASPAVLDALDRGVIGVGHAAEIARLPQFIQQEEVIAKQEVYRFPVKDLKAFVDQTLQYMKEAEAAPPKAPSREPPPPRVYACEGCKREVEPRFLRPVMLCPDCFGTVWKLGKEAKAPEGEAETE